jgi:hypothetical protein
VLFWIAWGRDVGADGSVTETVTVKVKRKTYAQRDWSAYNASQVHQREYVERLLRNLNPGNLAIESVKFSLGAAAPRALVRTARPGSALEPIDELIRGGDVPHGA